jgi:predicted metalloprotease with PDZ domain
MPGAQAAAAFWSNEATQKLPYQRGAMLAAIWNARLLAVSRGAVNLDTVLHAQITTARSSKEQATSLFQSLSRQKGLNIADDMARYLINGEPVLLPAGTFGPCAMIVTEQRPSFSRGFDADLTDNAGNVATAVDRLSPAYAAGLRDGMKILARTEGEPDNALVPYALLVEDKGKQRTIRYLPQGRERVAVQQIRITNAQSPECPRTLGGL